MGTCGAALLEALTAGEVDEEELADLHLLAERAVLRRRVGPLHDGQHHDRVAAAGVRVQCRECKHPGRQDIQLITPALDITFWFPDVDPPSLT